MENEIEFVNGIKPKPREGKTPDWVIGEFGINIASFREWMKGWLAASPDKEWLNVEMKMSKKGKPYTAVSKYEPEKPVSAPLQSPDDEDIPF